MTWNEFKDFVDKELDGKNPKILWIDTGTYPDQRYFKLEVRVGKDNELVID